MARTYVEPQTVTDALSAAAEHGPAARFVAGGTDLVVLARKRHAPLPAALIAIHRLAELQGVSQLPDGALRIGAATPHAVLEGHPAVTGRFTALADGSAVVGSPATRNVATLGGNLCNGSPAMDTGSPLLVLGASVQLRSATGARELTLSGFFRGPARTAAAPGELLTAVTIPAPPPGVSGSAYIRLDYRLAMEIAVVGAAAMVVLDAAGRVAHARVALTAVAPVCVLAPAVGQRLQGTDPDERAIAEAAEAAADVARPISDVRAPADYRAAMVPVVVGRALAAAVHRARGGAVPVPATLAMAVR